jgi:hypothetical protein
MSSMSKQTAEQFKTNSNRFSLYSGLAMRRGALWMKPAALHKDVGARRLKTATLTAEL